LNFKSLPVEPIACPSQKTNSAVAFKFKDINGVGKINFKGIYSSNNDLKVSIENFEKLQTDLDNILLKWNSAIADKTLNLPITAATINDNIDKCWNLLEVLGNPSDVSLITGLIMKSYVIEQITLNLKKYAQDLVDLKIAYDILEKVSDPLNPLDPLVKVGPLPDLDEEDLFKDPWGNINAYGESTLNPFANGAISRKVDAVAGSTIPPIVDPIPGFNCY